MNRPIVELAVAVALVALFAAGAWIAWGYHGQARHMPIALMGFGVLLSLGWAGQAIGSLRAGDTAAFALDPVTVRRFALIVAGAVVYVVGVTNIGFLTSTAIMVPVLAAVMGYRNWLVSIATSLGFVLILYGIFRVLLSIPLPPDIVVNLLGV